MDRVSLPAEFIELLHLSLDEPICSRVIEAISNTSPSISIRVNPNKRVDSKCDSVVNLAKSLNRAVPWCNEGYYLDSRPSFTFDPSFHCGAYYVQEASSMAIGLVKPFLDSFGKAINILDMCAAPGGKSTHLISLMPNGSHFTANEFVRARVTPLRENLIKWGNHKVKVTNFTSSQILNYCLKSDSFFDFILVDAPCSGEGMFRKDSSAIKEWSREAVELCCSRQRSILKDMWGSLADGGYLLYSTCTFNIFENDKNVEWMKENFGAVVTPLISIEQALEWGVIVADCGGYRFLPGMVNGEGLFMALLHKPKAKERLNSLSGLKSLVEPESVESVLSYEPIFENSLNLPKWELDRDMAIKYLSKESIKLGESAPKGLLIFTYGGLNLGYGKNIGSRVNNLYPQNWRIRSSCGV